MKEILHRLQPIQVYIVLALSVCYFLVQFYISQTSQSITLLVQTYHMLCNIIALSGCIISIKVSNMIIFLLSVVSALRKSCDEWTVFFSH